VIRYIIDTDTISLMMREDADAKNYVLSLPHQETGIAIVTYEEQVAGRLVQLRRANTSEELVKAYAWLLKTAELLAPLKLIPFTEAAMARCDGLKSQKLNIGSNDLKIAAIAMENDAAVVTRNIRDFARVPGLRVETWV
jgi:tRNA(fMet)-specific endonuclease VapC